MIGTLPTDIKYYRQDHVNTLVHAYNCMDSTATKFSPFDFMFGREPNLLIDIEFGVRTPDLIATSTKDYVEKLQKRLAWAFMKMRIKGTRNIMIEKLDVPNWRLEIKY